MNFTGLVVRAFAKSQGDQCSIPGPVIPKTQKMVLDSALLNTQHYKVRMKWGNPGNGVTTSPTSRCCSCWKKGTFGSPSTMVTNLLYFYLLYSIITSEKNDRLEYSNFQIRFSTCYHNVEQETRTAWVITSGMYTTTLSNVTLDYTHV